MLDQRMKTQNAPWKSKKMMEVDTAANYSRVSSPVTEVSTVKVLLRGWMFGVS